MAAFEYQAPKDDNYKNFESTKEFFRRYYILFPFAIYASYNLFLFKKNKISSQTEWKIGSVAFEKYIVAPVLNTKINKKYDGKIFR